MTRASWPFHFPEATTIAIDPKHVLDFGQRSRSDFHDFTRGFPTLADTGPAKLMPSVDVTETDKEIEITAELPGLEDKDIQINLNDNLLTIRGEKKAEKEQKDKNYRIVERSYGSFERTLELPEDVNADAIKADMTKGVLKVTVPKPAPAQSRKIEVKSATR